MSAEIITPKTRCSGVPAGVIRGACNHRRLVHQSLAADKTNQADHGKKRDPRDDEIKEMIKLELDNDARLKKRTFTRVVISACQRQSKIELFSEIKVIHSTVTRFVQNI